MTTIELPRAILRTEEELPFVDTGDGSHIQLLQVDVEAGVWVVRTRFQPGVTIPRHKHTGPVYAFTLAGAWKYLEYPDDLNQPGSFLYEPAGSIHTLHVPDDVQGMTDAVFVIHGANLNLDDDDNVWMVVDAAAIRDVYFAFCEETGHGRPAVIGT